MAVNLDNKPDTAEDDLYNPANQLNNLEKSSFAEPKDNTPFADSLADQEQDTGTNQGSGFKTDLSLPGQKSGGKGKGFFKGKKKGLAIGGGGIAGGIIALLMGSTSMLPFAMLGNMDMISPMRALAGYNESYMGFRIFGSKKGKVSVSGDSIKGLRDTEIDQLKANGVEFQPKDGIKTSKGKTTFSSVRVNGGDWVDSSNFNKTMRTNSSFRRAMTFNKGSYFKSFRTKATSKVKNIFKYNSDVKVKGDTPEETRQNLTNESIADGDFNITGSSSQIDDDSPDKDSLEKQKAQVDEIGGEASKNIKEQKDAIKDGGSSASAAKDADGGNAAYHLTKDGVDVDAYTKGTASKVWGAVNSLDIVDTVCTIYQTAYTANVIARSVALYNVVSFALNVRTIVEKAKAGDDEGELNDLMTLLSQKDPSTGRSFDSSTYAAFLFNGELSSEPSAVSATGGALMLELAIAMRSVHSLFGFGSAQTGRFFLKNACGFATNFGVQIGATIGSFAIGIITGGAGTAAIQGGKAAASTGLKAGAKKVVKEMGEKFTKDAIKKTLKEQGQNITEQGALKYIAKDSMNGFKKLSRNMTGWDKVGLLVAGVSTFGMGYIVSALSGDNIAGMTKNGFAMMDGIGTGWNQFEYMNSVESGGTVSSFDSATAYESTKQQYQDSYLADLRLEAADTPFDISNPYSKLGSLLYSVQTVAGVGSFTSLKSSAISLISLPVNLLSTAGKKASALDKVTAEQITKNVDDPFYIDNQIALTPTASPATEFSRSYDFEDILELAEGDNKQIEYNGEDSETGEPKISIVEGSDLSKYVDSCHNANRTELNPEYALDDNSNFYDKEMCMDGGSNFKPEYKLYRDAYRYANLVSPDETVSSSDMSSSSTAIMGDVGVSSSGWGYPTRSPSAACGFGCYEGHVGMDVQSVGGSKIQVGEPLYAMRDGEVVATGDEVAAGEPDAVTEQYCKAYLEPRVGPAWQGVPSQIVKIKSTVDGQEYYIRYSHLKEGSITVKVGDTVKMGQKIAEVGLTGCTTGTHSHITVSPNRNGTNPIDPTTLVGRSW